MRLHPATQSLSSSLVTSDDTRSGPTNDLAQKKQTFQFSTSYLTQQLSYPGLPRSRVFIPWPGPAMDWFQSLGSLSVCLCYSMALE
jgi:hypothetical protein